MKESRENAIVDLFDKICPTNTDDFLPVQNLRNSFRPNNFLFFKYSSVIEIKEMFELLVDLFVCLNITIKNQKDLDLDDFLYMCDNFSFFFEKEDEFKKFVNTCFK